MSVSDYQALQVQSVGLSNIVSHACLPVFFSHIHFFFPLSFLCSWSSVQFWLIRYYVMLAQGCFVEDFCPRRKERGTWDECSYLTTFALFSRLWAQCARMWWFGQSSQFAVMKMKEDTLGIQSRRSGKSLGPWWHCWAMKNSGQLTFDFSLLTITLYDLNHR